MRTSTSSKVVGCTVALMLGHMSTTEVRGGPREIAAQASGIDVVRERWIAFIVSAFIIGLAGALYAHFLSVVTPSAFFLKMTFIALAMLVVGGMYSLTGAVVGVVVISGLIDILRRLETGFDVGGTVVGIPNGVQEIAIGLIMIGILMFLPTGLTRNREWTWAGWPFGGGSKGS